MPVKRVSVAIALIAKISLIFFTAASAADKGEVRIGVMGALANNGAQTILSRQMLDGARIFVKSRNSSSGVLGQKLVIVEADDKCLPEKAVQRAKELVAKQVQLVIGPFCGGAAFAAAPIFEEAGVVMITPSVTHPSLTDEGRRNVFRASRRDDLQAAFIATTLGSLFQGKTVAIVHDQSNYGAGIAQAVTNAFASSGQVKTFDVDFNADNPNYRATLEDIQAGQPSAVFVGAYAPEAARLIKLMRSANFTIPVFGPDSLFDDSFGRQAGKKNAQEVRLSFAPENEGVEDAGQIKKLRALGLFNKQYALSTFIGLEMWEVAALAKQTTSGTEIADWLREGHRAETVAGGRYFDAKGDMYPQSFVWYVYKGGKWVRDNP